jgi:4-hydroxybenzoate polyprenyltransferase
MLLPGILMLGTRVIATCAILAMLAFTYFIPSLPFRKKRLRDFGLLKIVVLTSVWTATTALLPMLYLNAPIAHYPFELLLRFVFVFALCILFDIRDMETDNSRNIATLPNRIGMNRAFIMVYIALAVFVVLSVFQYLRFHDGGRLLAAITTALTTAFVSDHVRRNPGHKNFVTMTDGMMLLYAILVLMQ